MGLSRRALRWFTSYLTDRRQSVWINGETSETHQIALGVPQGSILGPLLFNIYINSLPKAVEKSQLIIYADDAVLFFTASEPLELQDALGRDYSLISKWYTDNRLTLNVKKTKLMLAGSKTMLSQFENFEFLPDGGQINRIKSFKYLGVTVDEKGSWKCHIKTLLRKLGHRLSVFNRISHMLDRRTRMAYFNGLVLPDCDYADIIWGDQPGLKSEMEQLQTFQNRFTKKIDGSKQSSAEAMASLKWIPLARRRFGHRCVAVQNAVKGDIPEHFDPFRSTLSQSHGYSTRNGYLPRMPKPRTEWGRRATYFRAINDRVSMPKEFKKPMPKSIFKRELDKFLNSSF